MEDWIPLSIPHMSGKEMKYVVEAFSSNWVSTTGPHITALEKELSEMYGREALAVSSGTAAIHLGLRALGIQSGDDVVVQSLTFAASCNPILYEGSNPIFVDSEQRTLNMDPELLGELLEKRSKKNRLPKAIIAVDLFGQSADYGRIEKLGNMYEIPILEDAAEAVGATYRGKFCGTFGTAGVFSLNGNKLITSGGGGILLSLQGNLMDRARRWSYQARDEDLLKIGNYVHSELGYNYRMSNVLAGIARAQFEVVEERVDQRRQICERYIAAFKNIPGIKVVEESGEGIHTRWLTCCIVDEKEYGRNAMQLIQELRKRQIDSRPIWKPLHMQPLYRERERIGGNIAKKLHQRGICLPSSSQLSIEEQNRVIEAIQESCR